MDIGGLDNDRIDLVEEPVRNKFGDDDVKSNSLDEDNMDDPAGDHPQLDQTHVETYPSTGQSDNGSEP